MTPLYTMVNECLLLLKQADMQHVKKLRIEIQLIQIKRLLLKEDIPSEALEGDLLEVLADILKIRKGEYDSDTVRSLSARLKSMLTLPESRSDCTGKAARAVSLLTALHSPADV